MALHLALISLQADQTLIAPQEVFLDHDHFPTGHHVESVTFKVVIGDVVVQ